MSVAAFWARMDEATDRAIAESRGGGGNACAKPHAEAIIKTCTCCGAAYSRPAWRALRYVGEHHDEVETLELRNCRACNSTLAIVVPHPGAIP